LIGRVREVCFAPKTAVRRGGKFDSNNSVTVGRIASPFDPGPDHAAVSDYFGGFARDWLVFGRVWEIRQGIKRQTATDSARLPSALVIVRLHWPTA
jgi:hypothetical protein